MDSDDDLPPVLVNTAVETDEEVENGPKVPLTIVTGEYSQIRSCLWLVTNTFFCLSFLQATWVLARRRC